MNTRPTLLRTLAGGLAGGAAVCAALYATFATWGGSKRGEVGMLFDPSTQSAKLIAIWKEIEPLPLLTSSPGLIIGSYFGFAIGYALVYRSVAAAWPVGIVNRVARLGSMIWLTGAFFEVQGPVNLAHQPIRPTAIALAFWAVAALAEALAVVAVVDRGVWSGIATTGITGTAAVITDPGRINPTP
ncbi:hypothetical protein I0C86_23935 [Plantactinospora sp. S1510]|uniref:Uncharacterized protein n=1 Tax=Plantactinospora alkalitolerans TaxID=2789879 RepID=A0ABS0H0K6_9ACTN|nr:hypothetical protein [Plantactinospora alkalitolerans]MBF9131992.1 hypothetical protein [Plantactinospora alkalitolerans]